MTTIICPKCGEPAQADQKTCTKCGATLLNPSLSTVHTRADPVMLRLRRSLPSQSDPTLPEHTISLQIRGMVEKLSFEEGTEVILGRYDVTASPTPRLDLSHYGAREKGVSREHAVLRFERDQLTITDLRSVNGTAVNRMKIEANQPHVLHNGDEIALGTLSIVVRFELATDTKIISVPPVQRGDDTAPIFLKSQSDSLPETRKLDPLDTENPESGV